MLDHFAIFTRSGLILWSFQLTALAGAPVDALIRSCLLEERAGERAWSYVTDAASYTLKWTFHNELRLVFVAVYQKLLQLTYVDELLDEVKRAFAPTVKERKFDYREFDAQFQRMLKSAEQRADEAKRPRAPSAFGAAAAGGKKGGGQQRAGAGAGQQAPPGGKDDDDDAGGPGRQTAGSSQGGSAAGTPAPGDSGADSCSAGPAFDISKLGKGKKGAAGGGGGGKASAGAGAGPGSADKAGKGAAADGPESGSGKKGKEKRVWDNAPPKNAKLDFSDPPPPGGKGGAQGGSSSSSMLERLHGAGGAGVLSAADGAGAGGVALALGGSRMDDADDEPGYDEEEEEEEEEDDSSADASASASAAAPGRGAKPPAPARRPAAPAQASPAAPKKAGWFASVLHSVGMAVAGKAALERADVAPLLEKMQDAMVARNVAHEIAAKLAESVATSLEGRRLAALSRLGPLVKAALDEALTRILTPLRSTDILAEAKAARERPPGPGGARRPYVVVFLGVNGVGKSTSLAKVAYWLLQHGLSVSIAACDTFRAGAVEQLRTHATRLGVTLFERGYGKDPAGVAADAIAAAGRAGHDVVLVDTAGRMQDNEPLMRALAKLVDTNRPDLVLFVGEALVGNDAVDQLCKFNQRLADFSTSESARAGRVIDGIVLTKFDTIDDKVGAALSMVYTSGAPVMFVGCGQTYTDIRKLNVKSIVRMLLS